MLGERLSTVRPTLAPRTVEDKTIKDNDDSGGGGGFDEDDDNDGNNNAHGLVY